MSLSVAAFTAMPCTAALLTLLRADGVLLPAVVLAWGACARQRLQHLDKSIIRASDDIAAAAAESDAVHCKAVAAQGALVAQLLHILAWLQQTPGAMHGWGPSCSHQGTFDIAKATIAPFCATCKQQRA